MESWILEAGELDSILDLLQHEPATWRCRVHSSEGPGTWSLELSPFLHDYADIRTGDEYVERLVQRLLPASPAAAPMCPSALGLPEAIDYLNALWRLHAGRPLFTVSRIESAAKLALPCSTSDEFDSRLTSFCAVLDNLNIPGAAGH